MQTANTEGAPLEPQTAPRGPTLSFMQQRRSKGRQGKGRVVRWSETPRWNIDRCTRLAYVIVIRSSSMELLVHLVVLVGYSCCIASVAWRIARYIEPGRWRLLAFSPLFVANTIPSMLFCRERGLEAILYYYAVTNYLWLVNCKLLALALNRGPVAMYRDQPGMFAWLLVFPINVASHHAAKNCVDHSLQAMLQRLAATALGRAIVECVMESEI